MEYALPPGRIPESNPHSSIPSHHPDSSTPFSFSSVHDEHLYESVPEIIQNVAKLSLATKSPPKVHVHLRQPAASPSGQLNAAQERKFYEKADLDGENAPVTTSTVSTQQNLLAFAQKEAPISTTPGVCSDSSETSTPSPIYAQVADPINCPQMFTFHELNSFRVSAAPLVPIPIAQTTSYSTMNANVQLSNTRKFSLLNY